jgi:hypothetical protein
LIGVFVLLATWRPGDLATDLVAPRDTSGPGLAGFAYANWLGLLSSLCLAVVGGTWLGTRVLGRVNEVWFARIYRFVLTMVALRLAIPSFPTFGAD